MSKKLRFGIIGCAGIAVNAVIPAFQASQSGVVAAIASRGEAKARETAEKLGIPKAYSSYEDLLADPEIDAVYIPLPNHLHREWAIRAAQAGKHVLCEKPIALNAREAQEMMDASIQAGVVLAEAFMYRHHPRMEQIKQMIEAGEIGDIRVIRGAFTFNNAGDAKNIRYRADWGGGSVYDVGCYPLSAARYLLGQEPEAVTCQAFFSPEHDGVDMMASGLVEFPGGVALTFDCGMWADFRQTLEIVGTEGRIELPHAFLTGGGKDNYFVTVKGHLREVKPEPLNSYTLQVDDFARTVAGEQPQLFSPDDAVSNMRLIDACLRSARERARIEL